MHPSRSVFLLTLAAALAAAAPAQSPLTPRQAPWFNVALPASPYEVTGGNIQNLTDAAARGAALATLDRARTHFTLLTNAAPPWQMSVSMSANGFPTYNGLGTMRQTWLANLAWYWTSQLGNAISDRYAARGLFSSNPQAPVPMAVEMARELLFWPLQYATDARISLREAHVVLNGQPATCVLVAPPLQEPADHRGWNEAEYCIDDANGLLRVKSQAPGAYAVYDYNGSISFHGHTMPGAITWSSASATLTLRIEGLTDADGVDPASIRPTPEMTSQGPSWQMMMAPFPLENWMFVGSQSPQPAAAVIEVTVSPRGAVQELLLVCPAEDASFNQAALDAVARSRFPPSPGQREVFFVVSRAPSSPRPVGRPPVLIIDHVEKP